MDDKTNAGRLTEVIALLVDANTKLDAVMTNTAIAAEILIDVGPALKPVAPAASDPQSAMEMKNENETLEVLKSIYGELVGSIHNMVSDMANSMRTVSGRSLPIMEDVASINVLLSQWYDDTKIRSKTEEELNKQIKARLDKLIDVGEKNNIGNELERRKREQEKAKKIGFGGWVLGIGALLAGLLKGFAAAMANQAKTLLKAIGRFLNVDKIVGWIKTGVKFFSQSFRGLLLSLKMLFQTKILWPLKDLWKALKESVLIKDIKRLIGYVKSLGLQLLKSFENRFIRPMRVLWEAMKKSVLAEDVRQLLAWVKGFGPRFKAAFDSRFIQPFRTLWQAMKSSILVEDVKQLMSWIKRVSSGAGRLINERLVKPLVGFWNAMKKIGVVFTPIKGFFSWLGGETVRSFSRLFNLKEWKDAFAPIAKTWSSVVRKAKVIVRYFSTVEEGAKAVSTFGKIISPIRALFARVAAISKLFFRFGSVLGKLFGELTYPVTWVIGFVRGWLNTEGDMGDKLIGGFKQGLKDLGNVFIELFLELPKKLISWIVGKLGWKDLERELDLIDFTKVWEVVVDDIYAKLKYTGELIGDALNYLWDKIAGIADTIMGWFGKSNKEKVDFQAKVGVEARGMSRNDKVLENGAKTLAAPETSAEKKSQISDMLIKQYGFSKQEVESAVKKAQIAPLAPEVAAPKVTAPPAPTTGATMNAIQKDTADKVGLAMSAAIAPATSVNSGHKVVNNNNASSIVYSSNNVPDRTAWQLTPAFGWG